MNVVIIANPWEQGLNNPTSKHHIARELVELGHNVLWINGTGMRRPSARSAVDYTRSFRKVMSAFAGVKSFKFVEGSRSFKVVENRPKSLEVQDRPRVLGMDGVIRVCAPLVWPFPGLKTARSLNAKIYARTIRKAGMKDAVLINFLPVCSELMKIHRGMKVYYCVDRWDAFDRYDSSLMSELDAECCRGADVVIASSSDLLERCRTHNANVQLITHGVSYEHFARSVAAPTERPADMPVGKVIGFTGLISEWVDQVLLKRLAVETGAQVVLIGKADVDVRDLEDVDGISMLGPRDFARLPDYVAHFDVGIIPFVVNDLTRSVNPIKLREMLAAGCPVVSTALPEVERFAAIGTGVRVARNADEFVGYVKQLLNTERNADDRKRISERVKNETWRAKVTILLEIINRR